MRASLRHALHIAVSLAPVAACSSAEQSAQAEQATELLVRPSMVALRAGETVQLAVQVNRAGGAPVGGAPLMFVAESTSIVRVSAQGLVSAVGVAGHDSLIVSSGTLRHTVPVTVAAGHPNVVDVTGGDRQVGPAGVTLAQPVLVTIRDAYGNAVPRSAVHFKPESGGEASPESVTTDAAGAARTLWTLGPLAGTQFMLVVADSTGSASETVEASALPGAMSSVVDIDPIGRRTRAGDTVAVRLRAQDRFGNGVEGAVFAFSVVAGGGEVVPPPRVESDSTGLVVARWSTGTSAGTNTLRVRAFQMRDTSFALTVRTIGGPPVSLALVSGDGQRARTLTAVQRPPVVRVLDQYGNPVAAVRVRFLAATPESSVQPLELVTDDQGNASPRTWILGEVGDQQLLVLADGVADTLRVRARATAR